jgi:hypothetical protein
MNLESLICLIVSLVLYSNSGPRRYEWVGGVKDAGKGQFKSASRWVNTRDLAAVAGAGSAASSGAGAGETGKPKSSLLDVMREELLEMTGHDILL